MAESPLLDYFQKYGVQGRLPADPMTQLLRSNPEKISEILSEEEKESLIGGLARRTGSSLGALGWLLDIPASAVRGVVGGDIDSTLASVDPNRERTEGRDLLRKWGVIGEEDTWGNFFGGLATEILLDPLTYFSFGIAPLLKRGVATAAGRAATKSGLDNLASSLARQQGKGVRQYMREATPQSIFDDAIKRAEQLPDAVSQDAAIKKAQDNFQNFQSLIEETPELLNQPLSKTNRLTIPFVGDYAFDLYGKRGGDFLAQAADTLGGGIERLAPYRKMRQLLDARAMNMGDLASQAVADELYVAQLGRQADDVGEFSRNVQRADKRFRQFGTSVDDPGLSQAMRSSLETGYFPEEYEELFATPEVRGLLAHMSRILGSAPGRADQLGVPVNVFDSYHGTRTVPRQQAHFDKPLFVDPQTGKNVPGKRMAPQQRTELGRVYSDDFKDFKRNRFLDLPGGSSTINKLSLDGDLQARLRKVAADNESVEVINQKQAEILDEYAKTFTPEGSSGPLNTFYDRYADTDIDALPGAKVKYTTRDMFNKAIKNEENYIAHHPELQQTYRDYLDAKVLKDKQKTAEKGIAELERRYGKNLYKLKHPNVVDSPLAKKVAADKQAYEAQLNLLATDENFSKRLAEFDDLEKAVIAGQVRATQADAKKQLAHWLTNLDPQHAEKQLPFFGRNIFQEVQDYAVRRGRAETTAEQMYRAIADEAERFNRSPGSIADPVSIQKAIKAFGFEEDKAKEILDGMLASRQIASADASVSPEFINAWTKNLRQGGTPKEINPILDKWDQYTNLFKGLTLAWPASKARDLYSGLTAAGMVSSANPLRLFPDQRAGFQLGRGNYKNLVEGPNPLLAQMPRYRDTFAQSPEKALEDFLSDVSGQFPGNKNPFQDELFQGAGERLPKEFFPGQSKPGVVRGFFDRFKRDPDRSWREFSKTFNPFEKPGQEGRKFFWTRGFDDLAQRSDDFNRYGVYINQMRKGATPEEAARMANLTQVDYTSRAFTDFEKNYLKRLVPFYSYQRGILPLVADELINRPAGFMGKTIRTIDRASDSEDEDNFLPSYLRSTAAIPLDESFPLFGRPEGSRTKTAINKIELPFMAPLQLLKAGRGTGILDRLSSAAQETVKSGLGQIHPLPKVALEEVFGQQFYTGRDMDDVFQNFEGERALKQLANLVPGASRTYGLYRQLTEDREDQTPAQRRAKAAINFLTGFGVTNFDPEESRLGEARSVIQDALKGEPGVRSYDQVYIKPENFEDASSQTMNDYLLYKTMQSDAAQRAKVRKRLEELQRPSTPGLSPMVPMSPDFYLKSALPR